MKNKEQSEKISVHIHITDGCEIFKKDVANVKSIVYDKLNHYVMIKYYDESSKVFCGFPFIVFHGPVPLDD